MYTYKQLQAISATKQGILDKKYIQDNGDVYIGVKGGQLVLMKDASEVVIVSIDNTEKTAEVVINENTTNIKDLKTTNLVEIDFGGLPGGNVAQLDVSNALIRSDSIVLLSMPSLSTIDHNAAEHELVPIKLTYGNIVNKQGFRIKAVTEWRLTGKFNVKYSII